jgi:hypothetical protein
MESHSGMMLTAERKSYPSATLSTTYHIWTCLGMNLGLYGERPVTNHLSHGMALLRNVEYEERERFGCSYKLLIELLYHFQACTRDWIRCERMHLHLCACLGQIMTVPYLVFGFGEVRNWHLR